MTSQAYFDRVAPQWDALREGLYSAAVRDAALAVAGVQAGKRAADIGAGTGFMTEGLIAQGLRVIAVDQSAAMLAAMQRKFAGVAEIEYRVGEAAALPIQTAVVDYAFATMYLHHVEAPLVALQELVRILRPGGRLVVTDLDEHEVAFLQAAHHDRWRGFAREDIKRWCAQAGLQDVVVDSAGEDCTAASSGGDEVASVSIFVASGTR